MSTYVLFHNDTDGFAASYAAFLNLTEKVIEANYIPVNYNQPMPEIPDGSYVYILDFSYSRDILIELNKRCYVTVIDHHKSAQENLKDLDFCIFDMTKSGAVLAWEYFHSPFEKVPLLLEYVQDFDLWQFKLPHSKEINLAIKSYKEEICTWNKLSDEIDNNFNKILAEGIAINRFQDSVIETIVKNCKIISFDGFKVATANVCYPFISEAGNKLCEVFPEVDFSLTFFIDNNGNKCYSLRSIKDIDVSIIAKKYNGGGHKHAAGFIEKL